MASVRTESSEGVLTIHINELRLLDAAGSLAKIEPRACTDFCINGVGSCVQGDSPIFVDTKIGTVPEPLGPDPRRPYGGPVDRELRQRGKKELD